MNIKEELSENSFQNEDLEFLKISTSPYKLVDLMLYYVEQGVKYTLAYGDIDEPFYESIESVYEDSLDLIKENTFMNNFTLAVEKLRLTQMVWDGGLVIILKNFLRSIIKKPNLSLTDKRFAAYI